MVLYWLKHLDNALIFKDIGGFYMDEYRSQKHLDFEEVLKNRKYYEELFSEGSEDLKRILVYCFDNGIETYMCCRGHDYFTDSFAIFSIPNDNVKLIDSMIQSTRDIIGVLFSIGQDHNKEAMLVDIRLPFSSDYYAACFFQKLYEGLSKSDNYKDPGKDVKRIIELLKKVRHTSYELFFQNRSLLPDKKYHAWLTLADGKSPIHKSSVLEEDYDYQQLMNVTPEYIFQKIDRLTNEAEERGVQKIKI